MSKLVSLSDLKADILSKTLPKEIQLGPGQLITNVKKFIEGHISTLEGNVNSRHKVTFMPYYYRLAQLNDLL